VPAPAGGFNSTEWPAIFKKRDYEEMKRHNWKKTAHSRQQTADNKQQTANSKHTYAPLFVTMLVPAAKGS
jgi:hypothetical protein